MPVLNVIDLDDPHLAWLPPKQRNWLKKTSIDYVLCAGDDQPLAAADFDRLQQGLNRGNEYVPLDGITDEWRRAIFELKLRVAHQSGFAYFVLSSNEFRDLSPELSLTLADGILGSVVANLRALDHLRDANGDVLMAQILSEIRWNPITKKKWELWDQLGRPEDCTSGGAAMPPPSEMSGDLCLGSKGSFHKERQGIRTSPSLCTTRSSEHKCAT